MILKLRCNYMRSFAPIQGFPLTQRSSAQVTTQYDQYGLSSVIQSLLRDLPAI